MEGVQDPLIYDPNDPPSDSTSDFVVLEAYVTRVQPGTSKTIKCKILANQSGAEITLSAVPITNEFILGSVSQTRISSSVTNTESSSDGGKITVYIKDGLKCDPLRKRVEMGRHPYFVFGNDVYTQRGPGSDRRMDRMSLEQFNLDKTVQEAGLDPAFPLTSYTQGEITITPELKTSIEAQFLAAYTAGARTSMDCIQQPDDIFEAAGADLIHSEESPFRSDDIAGAAGLVLEELQNGTMASGNPNLDMLRSLALCAKAMEGTKSLQIAPVASIDPNDKVGAQGVGEARYLSGEEPLRYVVFFENQETATAPAQEVVITDQLDMTKMDLSSCSLGPIAFGAKQVVPPLGLCSFTTDVDLRPDKNLLVRINVHLDPTTGLLTWRFTSLDPATGLPPEDPMAGFLPPNVTPPEGDGSVLFTVRPKPGLPTGTEVRNQANIIFDTNAPIATPQWFNTLDNTKPASQVGPLAASQSSTTFPIQWAGTDEGAGIKDYSISVSDNGGSFTPWLVNTPATGGSFTGQPGHQYAFYSIARDGAGNLETSPALSDASTEVSLTATSPVLAASILPSSRSVQVGVPATAFATIINAGPGLATGCTLAPLTLVPATFTYQTTDPGTLPIGAPNTPIDIPVGVAQSFVFALTPTAPFPLTDVQFSFACANSAPASVIGGVNTLLLVASATPVPDIIALGDTPTHNGMLTLASIGAFGVATVNVGIGAVITVTPDTGSANLPLTLSICQTNPATAACLALPTLSVTTQIDANATPTFSIFADATDAIPLDAATNRIFVRFTDGGGVTRGATSVAVCTQPGCS